MKKNIIIAILVLTNSAMFLYAFSQKTLAEQQTILFEQAILEADSASLLLEAQTSIALQALEDSQEAQLAAEMAKK